GWLEAQPGPALIVDLAGAAGVSQRTLRTAFQAYLGVGPLRYLKLRQLHPVPPALRVAKPGWATVTEVAIRSGVWEVGRVSREYRLRFGQVPSATLRRTPPAARRADEQLVGVPALAGASPRTG